MWIIVSKNIGTADNQILANKLDASVVIQNGIILPCPPGCRTCNDPQNCLGCYPGFYVDSSNKCKKCVSGCSACVDGTACSASSCLPGRYYSGGNCPSCDSSCLTCTGSATTNCDSCKLGYYLTGSTTCVACTQANCDVCTPTTGAACTRCRTGFVWDSSASLCVACISGCSKCKATKLWECDTSCPTGFEKK